MSKVIGVSANRLDAPAKAVGKALYTADYSAPDMLHVVLVRAETAHARLLNINVPPLPEGVFCFTYKDLPSNLLPSIMNDQPVLAEDHIRYQGEAVAIVAAPTPEQARAFAAQVKVDVRELELVDDMCKALEDGAPRLFDKGNLCNDFHSLKGDPDAAFEKAYLVLEDEFRMPVQAHGFLEPEAAFTYLDEQGRLCLISSTQNAFADQNTIASVLNRPLDSIASRAATVGGAFGGKDGNTAQIFPAIVTHYTGRPAKCVFTREENIRYGMKRHATLVRVRMAFAEDGTITALEGKMWMDTGAYAILGPAVLGLGAEHMTGPYYIENVRLDGWEAYTNHAPASAMRGFGAPQSAMAVETLLNRAAAKLGIGLTEIRRRNAIHQGQPGSMGAVMEHSVGFEEAIDLFEQSDFYREMTERPEEGVGYGIAAGMMSSGMGKHVPDTATVRIDRNGDRYIVRVGLVDIGQGSETTLAMIAAEALDVPLEKIDMRMGNTDEAIGSGSTAASRSTYVCGNAIIEAAKRVKAGETSAEASFSFPEIQGENGVHSMFGFIVQGVKLKVNPVTGAVRLLDVHNVTEAGHIIHPVMIAGQIFGGIAMSTGYALSEEVRTVNGRTLEDGFANYIMPTAMDAPRMSNANVMIDEETGPYGAKGIAEASTVALAPAVASALMNLYPGIRINRLPIDREEVLRAMSH